MITCSPEILLLQKKGRETALQAFLACLMMFITGSSFSLGVFTVAIEQEAIPKQVLNGVWPSAMGVMHFVSAPIMVFTGLFLDGGSAVPADFRLSFTSSKTCRVRILTLFSAVSYALFAAAGAAVDQSDPLLLRAAVATQAIPLGINYLLTTTLLVAWIPDRPGLAVGCGQLSFGIGSVLFVAVFENLIEVFGAASAIYITAGILTAAVLPCVLLRWPQPITSTYTYPDDRHSPLIASEERAPEFSGEQQPNKHAWHQLLLVPSFWMYIAIVFTAGAGYAFVPYFFKLGQLFGQETSLLVRVYQVTSLAASTLGLLGSMCTDFIGFGDGYWFSGSKNLCTGLMALQTAIFLSLGPLCFHTEFAGFIFVVSMQIILSVTLSGCSALLARDLFGPAHSYLVFGISAGLAIGSGEWFSTALIATVEARMEVTMESPPSAYNMFYIIAAVWSFGGFLSTIAVDQTPDFFKLGSALRAKSKYDSTA